MKVLVWSAGSQPYSAAPIFYKAAFAKGYDVTIAGERSDAGARALLETFAQNKYDWLLSFVSLPRYNYVFDAVRSKDARVMLWYADQLNPQVKSMWGRMRDHVDVVACASMRTTKILKSIGFNAHWIPQYFEDAAYASRCTRLDPNKKMWDVCFIGGYDVRRKRYLKNLEGEFSVILRGPREHSTDSVFGNDMVDIYAQSKVAVNIQRKAFLCEPTEFNVSNRVFRAMGSGAFLLHFADSKLTPLFQPGTYYGEYDGSYDDLVQQIRYYLTDGAEDREVMARIGQLEVLMKHTLEKRLREYWQLMKA